MQTQSITVHATYKDIRQPAEHLRAMLSANQVPEEVINLCEMALQELLTNLVDHAYTNDASGLIKVTLRWQNAQIIIETRDQGTPIGTDALNSVSMPDPSELAEGGYGMAIIQAVMDKVEYRRENDENIWQLVKELH